ncbi:histidine kinase [Longibacter salinarum]|uniref:histidine kinase n=1 Tax=Longibacter salinarum TaxID=1850348 RepID=A0A2A8CWV5_9BACT|nr:ATP-binding protein [Longibacter salinarum]PEN12868.1 histidine kinase [Longibacter salinarum]
MAPSLVLLLATAYLGLLFAVAYYGDERAERGRSIIANPYIYALSLAVYCTAWTFYGSVGRAATSGLGFLPIYLGPTLIAVVGWILIRKIVRISRYQRITSISDFIASRYGKSARLAGVVAVVALMGVVPYIALQLKAIATSYTVLVSPSGGLPGSGLAPGGVDTAFWISLFLAAFAILFGTRHLDVTERHEGLVAAIAFESVVKLVAFLAVGLYVTFGMFDGFSDLFAAGAEVPAIRQLYSQTDPAEASEWIWLTGLSMLAFLLLPRQFQVAVVENVDERHIRKATWLFPLYLFAINLFVLPIAVGGLLTFGDAATADAFVLSLPLSAGNEALAMLAFIGGLSAATGMVIVATTALSTMICNDLLMPVLLRIPALRLADRPRLTGLILGLRRGAIIVVLLLGYAYLETIGESYSLVSIGLISFVAVAQFAPPLLGGLYWRRGTKYGALAGLLAGVAVWGYTLPLPSLAETGFLPNAFVEDGPFGIALLRPYAMFGLDTLSHIPHALFWSLSINTGLYAAVSLFTTPTVLERSQAHLFVEVYRHAKGHDPVRRATASVRDIRMLLQRFLGWRRTERVMEEYAKEHRKDLDALDEADETLVRHAETALAGAIGASSAQVAVSSVVKETPLRLHEVLSILDEAQQVLAYSRELERKQAELEATTRDLQAANEKLKQVDRLKDDFVSTVTHELRTPLTAIRALTEILHANPDLGVTERTEFLDTIQRETRRLTRLVNQVLDLQRLEAERVDLSQTVYLEEVLQDATSAMQQSIERDGARLHVAGLEHQTPIAGERDRLMQVALNLLSNAAKFCNEEIRVRLIPGDPVIFDVQDDGPGISADDQDAIFEKFRQLESGTTPGGGSGLGLAIAQKIIHAHGGVLKVDSEPREGATFSVHLPAVKDKKMDPSETVATGNDGSSRSASFSASDPS